MNEKPVILVVDDNNLNRRIMSNFIQKMNANVIEVDSSMKVPEKVKTSKIDMIIMDVFMPSLRGYECVKEVRSMKGDKGKTPIIGVSTSSSNKTKEDILAVGMDDLVIKPLQKLDIDRLFSQYFKSEKQEIFNIKEFEYFYKDPGLRKEILDTFIEESKTDITKINVAFNTRDCDNIYKLAHYLKGTFNYLKANKSLETSMQILTFCKDGQVKEVLKLEYELSENYKNLVTNVEKYMKQNNM